MMDRLTRRIFFNWGRGATTNVGILDLVDNCAKNKEPCYINILADSIGLSHVAIKKKVDIFIEQGYIEIINPNGKPHYLLLTDKGKELLNELKLEK